MPAKPTLSSRIADAMEKFCGNRIAGAGLVLMSMGYFAILAFSSDGSWGGADATVHYRMARYSWVHPELLLDMWGKPMLTIFSSPFAQFAKLREYFGNPLYYLSIAGLLGIAASWFITPSNRRTTNAIVYLWLLIILPAFTYLFAHSYVYWKGIGGAAGLDRIISPIIPMAAIVAIIGVSMLSRMKWGGIRIALPLFLLILSVYAITIPFKRFYLPPGIGGEETIITEASDWIINNGYVDRKLVYYHPYLLHSQNKDPYNTDIARERIPLGIPFHETLGEGWLVIWDSHFGPHEGMMPLDSLTSTPSLKLLRVLPDTIMDWNSDSFMVYIFERVPFPLNTSVPEE